VAQALLPTLDLETASTPGDGFEASRHGTHEPAPQRPAECEKILQPFHRVTQAGLVGSGGCRQLHLRLQRYNEEAMKLEIELNIADDAADKVELQERLRKEAILALFADRKIPAGNAARELGLERIPFMELLKQRGIPYVVYTVEDWEADANGLQEFERRRANR
jgi:predicted HTH domain antitoxin